MNKTYDPASLPQQTIFVGEPLRQIREGVGVNMFLGRERNCPPTSRRDLWEHQLALLDEARPGFLRIGYLEASGGPDDVTPWDDAKQEFQPDHDFWRKLEIIDGWCGRHDVNWALDSWWVPRSMQVAGAPNWRGGPRDPADYARRYIAPLVRHVRTTLGLQRCRYLGLLNEPIWGAKARDPENFFVGEGRSQVQVLAAMYREVRKVIDPAVGLMGPAHLCAWQFPVLDFVAAGCDPSADLAAWDMHSYFYRLDWMNDGVPDFPSTQDYLQTTVRRWTDFAGQQGKPFFITEMGCFYYGRPFWGERDYETLGSHTAAVTDAQLIVRALAEGVDGFLRWAWCVPKDVDGRWGLVEWEGANAITPSPNIFPMYRLLMRTVRPRATILQTRVGVADCYRRRVHAISVRNTDGKLALLIVHDTPGHNSDVRMVLGPEFAGKTLRRTVVDEMRKGVELAPITVTPETDLMITPYSLTVLEEQ